jgi:hypothetical protein
LIAVLVVELATLKHSSYSVLFPEVFDVSCNAKTIFAESSFAFFSKLVAASITSSTS